MSRHYTIGLIVLGASLVWSGTVVGQTASTQTQTRSRISAADRKFVLNAARGGMAEVEKGELATKNGSSQAVKDFGQRMVDDHGKANDELKQLAASKGITLPSALGRKQQRMVNRLSHMTAQSFDRAYAADMVKDHEEDVRAFEKEAASGRDPDVKAWAAKTLPTLQEHLRMARGLSGTAAR